MRGVLETRGPSLGGLRSRPLRPFPSWLVFFFFFFPCALGFEWRWHRLASGSRRGSSRDSQDSGFSPHGVAGLTCTALALCSTVPRVTKAMSPFGRLATLESPFHSVFGALGAEESLAIQFTLEQGTHPDPTAPLWAWWRRGVTQPSVPRPVRCFHLPPGGALSSSDGFALSHWFLNSQRKGSAPKYMLLSCLLILPNLTFLFDDASNPRICTSSTRCILILTLPQD